MGGQSILQLLCQGSQNLRPAASRSAIESDAHCLVHEDDGGHYLVEQLRQQGCYVNERFLGQGEIQRLQHGDIITLCKNHAKFRPVPAFVFLHQDRSRECGRRMPVPTPCNASSSGSTTESTSEPANRSLTLTVSETARWSLDRSLGLSSMTHSSSTLSLSQTPAESCTVTLAKASEKLPQPEDRDACATLPLPGARCLLTLIDGAEEPSQCPETQPHFSAAKAEPKSMQMDHQLCNQQEKCARPSSQQTPHTGSKRTREEIDGLEGSIIGVAPCQPTPCRLRSTETISNSLSWTRSGSSLSESSVMEEEVVEKPAKALWKLREAVEGTIPILETWPVDETLR